VQTPVQPRCIGGGIGAIIDHNKGTAYTYPTWVQRVFDRSNENEGQHESAP
jgi:hypothetical protein